MREPKLEGDALNLSPNERETQDLLTVGWRPAAPKRINHDALMFRAGLAAGRADARRDVGRRLFAWRAAAAVLLGGVVLSVLSKSAPTEVHDPVVAVRPATTTPSPRPAPADSTELPPSAVDWLFLASNRPFIPAAGADYLTVRDAVLRWGVGVLPAPAGDAVSTVSASRGVDSLMEYRPRRGNEDADGLSPVRRLQDLLFDGSSL